MKIMKSGKNLPIKVKDKDAIKYEKLGYTYCPKSEWKEKVRDSK